MAISRVGSWVYNWGGSTASGRAPSTGVNNVTISYGSVPTAGDYLIIFEGQRASSTLTTLTSSNITGITSIAFTQGASGVGHVQAWYWKCDGSTDPSLTFTWSAGAPGNSTVAYGMAVFTGVHATTPVDATDAPSSGSTFPPTASTSSSARTFRSISSTTSDGGTAFFLSQSGSATLISSSAPSVSSGATNDFNLNGLNGASGGIQLDITTYPLSGASATGSITETFSSGNVTTGRSLSFVLRAAAGGGGSSNTAGPFSTHTTFTLPAVPSVATQHNQPPSFVRFRAAAQTQAWTRSRSAGTSPHVTFTIPTPSINKTTGGSAITQPTHVNFLINDPAITTSRVKQTGTHVSFSVPQPFLNFIPAGGAAPSAQFKRIGAWGTGLRRGPSIGHGGLHT